MKLIYLCPIIDFRNDLYHVDYVIENENGELLTCTKTCKNSLEADAVYNELFEILQAHNPSNTIIVDNESIYTI